MINLIDTNSNSIIINIWVLMILLIIAVVVCKLNQVLFVNYKVHKLSHVWCWTITTSWDPHYITTGQLNHAELDLQLNVEELFFSRRPQKTV